VGPNKALVIAGGVVAGAAAAAGFGFLGGAFAKASERDAVIASLPNPEQCRSSRHCPDSVVGPDRMRMFFLTAMGYSFIGAGVVAAGTLTYALVPRRAGSLGDTKVAVTAGPGAMGVGLTVPW
jgi:hypothetical protein